MKKDEYDVIIIGAGIGGLTAGNILAKNGMKVLILEKNQVPGGAVTTFYKDGYPIDITHSLCGIREGAVVNRIFDYLNINERFEFLELEKPFIYIPKNQNKPIFCYGDFSKYAEELKLYFPAEHKNIKKLFNEITKIWQHEAVKSYSNPSLSILFLYPFLFPHLFKYRNYTFEKFLNRFISSPALKEIISVYWLYLGLEKGAVSALYMICLLGAYHTDKSCFVKGGFGRIPVILASNFEELGGRILYNTEVDKILLNSKKVTYGVRDKNNNEYYAKKIASNIDSKKTFLELIERRFLPQNLINRAVELKMSCSAIQIHLIAEAELNRDFLSVGTIVLPLRIDLEKRLKMLFKFNSQSYTKPVLSVNINCLSNFDNFDSENIYIFNIGWLPANYILWKKFINLYGRKEYEDLKSEIVQLVIKEIRKFWVIKKVKLSNVLTPVSFEKWLNATEGAIYDIAASPQQTLLRRFHNKTPIENLFLVGAKTFPGAGIPGALISATSFSDIVLKGKLTNGKVAL
ncbi:MAG: NAD(P)/FAD-dependent oxidoreductase [Candidatus Omnitrophica bacterium]|nr:NAD(P)/FAD-dependent oxidoreductase [Candidatus Omnitrophota bacterium]